MNTSENLLLDYPRLIELSESQTRSLSDFKRGRDGSGVFHIKNFISNNFLQLADGNSSSDGAAIDIDSLPVPLRQFIWELHSGPFIELLECLSGLELLLPDPHLSDSGLLTIDKNPMRLSVGVRHRLTLLENKLSLAIVLSGGTTLRMYQEKLTGDDDCESYSTTASRGECVIINPAAVDTVGVEKLTIDNNASSKILLLHYYSKN